jgi:hypothetical protein
MNKVKPIAVICQSRRQFDDWLNWWLNPEERAKFVCITRDQDFRGQTFSQMIKLGNWYHNPNATELITQAQLRIEPRGK